MAGKGTERMVQGWQRLGLGTILAGSLMACTQVAIPQDAGCEDQVWAIARGQAAYFQENGQFAATLAPLNLDLPAAHPTCRYRLDSSPTRVIVYGQPETATRPGDVSQCFLFFCWQPDVATTSWVAGVFVVDAAQRTTQSIECRAQAGLTVLPPPQLQNGTPTCAPGTIPEREAVLRPNLTQSRRPGCPAPAPAG